MSPTFTSLKMKKMHSLIKACSEAYLENFEMRAKTEKESDIWTVHGNFTIDVIANCAFATKTNSHSDPNDKVSYYCYILK